MSLTIQSNASGDWLDITTLPMMSNTDVVQLGFNNADASAYTVRLWAAGVGNEAPANVADRQGKEIITEGWLECKLAADTVWTALKFPAPFPLTFAGIAAISGVFTFTAGATARTLIDFRMVHPGTPSTVGEALFQLTARYV